MARKGALTGLRLWWDPHRVEDSSCRYVLLWDKQADGEDPFLNFYHEDTPHWEVAYMSGGAEESLIRMGWKQLWPKE